MASLSRTKGRTRQVLAVLGTATFLAVAPGTVAGYIPWRISRWRLHPPFLGFTPFRAIGVALIGAGVIVVVESFGRFALEEIGTPAPLFPTQRLIVRGLYRYVRNPMYVAVVSIILGQALLLGDPHLITYAVFPWLVAHVFVLTYEEPTLRRSFGADYETYCAHVRRWIPRFTPWH